MEFGLVTSSYTPKHRREADADAEHHSIMNDIALAEAADKAGFKYVWVNEHHFLDEYSHMSANDVILGYLAHSTARIHLGSGIFNPLAQLNHPAKVAERVAMLDHVSDGRFEFGTGRGAGSYEILAFLHQDGITDASVSKEIWEESIGEFAKMWLQDEYQGFKGKWWSLPPRKVLPKPWKKPHPPLWYAAGNAPSYEMAARKGLGVLGFSVGSFDDLAPVLDAYKKQIGAAEPVGAYVNDNVMVASAGFVAEDRQTARSWATAPHNSYLASLLYRYHDTFPRPDGIPRWPELVPDLTLDMIDDSIRHGAIVGDPDDALVQVKRWQAAGVDQFCLGVGTATKDQMMETIRLFGEHIIPKIDTDPMHRTARMRQAATR